jgi:SAM-dependent methyltransferase
MMLYSVMYRLGVTPWERYGTVAAASIGALLDREEVERSRPLGRALDLGCGRGQKAAELARRGWEVVGVDNVPRAIDAAERKGIPGATFVVGDVTNLEAAGLGTFDFFFDGGCFQHLDAEQRLAAGRGVTALANPGATLLMIEFQPTRLRSWAGGVTQAEVEVAFPGWEMLSVEPAQTKGLGWPMTRMAPLWFRLRWTGGPAT